MLPRIRTSPHVPEAGCCCSAWPPRFASFCLEAALSFRAEALALRFLAAVELRSTVSARSRRRAAASAFCAAVWAGAAADCGEAACGAAAAGEEAGTAIIIRMSIDTHSVCGRVFGCKTGACCSMWSGSSTRVKSSAQRLLTEGISDLILRSFLRF